MSFLKTIKGAVAGAVLIVSYTCFILDIIMILKVRTGENTYPPAVVALMVSAILQMCYMTWYVAGGASKKLFSAMNVLLVTLFFACFTFGAVVATTVLRDHNRYCGPSSTNKSDCDGVLRGTEGVGFMLFGFDLIYMVIIGVAVGAAGSWSEPLGTIGTAPAHPTDAEKAPAH